MSDKPRFGKRGLGLSLISGLILLLLLAVIGLNFKASSPDLENRVLNSVKERDALSRMRVNLLKSVDIEKAAVMADTDELSRSLAEESLKAAQAVERDRIELRRLIEEDRIEREMALLHDFDTCWDELQKIDKVLLEFAVENSNIKAANLSFTQGSLAINRFKQNLSALIEKSPTNQQIQRLASDALVAGFEIHYLHAPHIAAANDTEMNRIETEIAQLSGVVHSCLKEMEGYVTEENQSFLHGAVFAFRDFESVTSEVLRLSRQNTNLKSFELSLGRKRKITAQCDDTLTSLSESIRSRTFEATR
ncbi:MAG: hypothetical protein ACLGPL_07950 [Acidobacteriota bacterium]